MIADLHVGSTVGLWPRRHVVEGGGVYEVSKYQLWLLRCWRDLLRYVAALETRPVLVICGDAIQGVSPRDGQLISNRPDIQCEAAEKLLRPLVEQCSRLYWIRGTEYHEGRSSEHVEQLAKALGAIPHHTTGQYTRWEMYLDVGGSVIHFAHSIGSTSVPHYESTIPTRDALMLLAELQRFFGSRAPNVEMVVRAHRHRYVQVQLPPKLTALVCPAWQLRTAFAYKKANTMLPEIGFVDIHREAGRLVAVPHIYPLAPIHIERLEDVDVIPKTDVQP